MVNIFPPRQRTETESGNDAEKLNPFLRLTRCLRIKEEEELGGEKWLNCVGKRDTRIHRPCDNCLAHTAEDNLAANRKAILVRGDEERNCHIICFNI